jgi:putative ABC transport system permease protein
VTALDRKLLRDLWHHRGQATAVALVVACGIASFIVARTAYRSILLCRDDYYSRYRFADVFVTMKRAPNSMLKKAQAIPGVAEIEARVAVDVTLDVPGLPEPATGHIVSVPEGSSSALNRLVLRRGRNLEPRRREEIIASEAFATANQLSVGDRLGAVLNGRWESLRIVGIALSPEYVYEIRGAGNILPDNRRFGILWMSREALGPAFDMEGGFNDLALTLSPASNRADVIAALDRLFARFGSLGAYGREDQVSNNFLDNELTELSTEGRVVPVIFFGVAIFLLHIVVTRLVNTQRDQIAVLKALGYGNAAIALHFLKFVLVMVFLGAALGTAVGLWLGRALMSLYAEYFRFPVLHYEAGGGVIVFALIGSAGAAILGALGSVRRAVSFQPAEAMRPEAPAGFRHGILDQLPLTRMLKPEARMIARNLTRRPLRFALSVLGVSLAVGILVLGRYFWDTVSEVLEVQFQVVERQDATVAFTNPRSARAAYEIGALPGVLLAEPFRAVPVRLRSGHWQRRTVLLGLGPHADLRRVIDRRRAPVVLPPEGLVLSAHLAERLGVRPGEWVTVEVLEGNRPVHRIPVAGCVDELIGISAYMDLTALNRLLREGGSISGGYLQTDSSQTEALYSLLKRIPAVEAISLQQATIRSFEDTIAKLLGTFTTVLVVLASVIALSIVYNGARIALSERGRDLASLRVLGFTRHEVTTMLLGEQALITALAIPIGWGIGLGACLLVSKLYDTDLMRMPFVVTARSFVLAAITVAAATFLSGLVVRRRIDRMDLVAVLKTRE